MSRPKFRRFLQVNSFRCASWQDGQLSTALAPGLHGDQTAFDVLRIGFSLSWVVRKHAVIGRIETLSQQGQAHAHGSHEERVFALISWEAAGRGSPWGKLGKVRQRNKAQQAGSW